MQEILSKRTYNQKVFKIPSRKKRYNYKIHAGHIHYKDRQGKFVDSDIQFRRQFNGTWIMNQHNYNFIAPKYADEEFSYYNGYKEADHYIKLRLMNAAKIKGIQDEEKNILYKDALGEGIDFKAILKRSGIQKVIIIHKNPEKDMSFDFELILDKKSEKIELEDVKEKKTEKIETLDRDIELTGKICKMGEAGKQSYIKQAHVWDSNEKKPKIEEVKITIFKKDGKTYLRKFIPKEFFDDAVFPVITDHPTNYYGDTADGYIISRWWDWAGVHSDASGNSFNSTFTGYNKAMSTEAYLDWFWYHRITRSFFYFDTGAIGDNDTIDSCILNIYKYEQANSDVSAQKGTQADVLSVDDYDAFEGDEYGHVTWNDGWNIISFNAQGLLDINKLGMTKICCREYTHDYLNASSNGNHVNGAQYANHAISIPYLDIEATAGEEEEGAPSVYTSYEPYNCYVEIRNKTFDLIKVLNKEIKKLDWEYLRIGGYGRCAVPLAMSPEDIEDYIAPDYEVRIYMDTNVKKHVFVYRGFIEKYKPIISTPDKVQIQAYGYSAQLKRSEVIKTYDGVEVSEIVKDILDTFVSPKTPITYDEEDIETTTFTPEKIVFNTLANSAMQTLGRLAGNYEWGVDANLKFYFKKPINDVYNFIRIQRETTKFDEIHDYAGIINRIILQGGEGLSETINNSESQDAYGIRSKIVSNSAITTPGVAQQYGSMLLLDTAGIVRRASLRNIKNQILYEDSIPLGRIGIVKEPVSFAKKFDEDYYNNFKYGGMTSYEINRIKYSLTSEGVNVNLELDRPRPDVAKTLEQFEFELGQIRNL